MACRKLFFEKLGCNRQVFRGVHANVDLTKSAAQPAICAVLKEAHDSGEHGRQDFCGIRASSSGTEKRKQDTAHGVVTFRRTVLLLLPLHGIRRGNNAALSIDVS